MSELSMPLLVLPETSKNGRPINSHDRHIDSDSARDTHVDHVQNFDALCMVCGCCWCCDDDCCSEYVCPNPGCGCNEKPAPTSRVQAIEAAEDRADQVAFDAWRERGL